MSRNVINNEGAVLRIREMETVQGILKYIVDFGLSKKDHGTHHYEQ